MHFLKANKVERFLTYFIDFAIIGVIASAIVSGIYAVAGYDTKVIDDILQRITLEINKITTGNMDFDVLKNLYTQYMQHALFEALIGGIVYLILITLYLVILPMFWPSQTLGRLIMKTKVVNKDGTEASKRTIIFREIIGSFLCYAFFGGVFIIASAALVAVKERSLADYIGGADLASVKILPKSENKDEELDSFDDNDSSDYVDAKFKEVEDSSKEEDKFKIDDDDYKII